MNEVDELKERIEELNNEVEELEQALEEAEPNDDRFNEGYEKAMLETENKICSAFYNGFEIADVDRTQDALKLRAFLTYKMEQRL